MRRSSMQSVLVVLALSACAGEPPDDEDAPARDRGACGDQGDDTSTRPRSSATTALVNLCPLVRLPMFDAGGLYRVASVEAEYEEDPSSPGSKAPFTYVELELLEPWFNANTDATARIRGGPTPCGTIALPRVSLIVGETVGALLLAPTPENRGHYGLHPLGIFKRTASTGFTNGQLVIDDTTEADLGQMITAIAEAEDTAPCPYDLTALSR